MANTVDARKTAEDLTTMIMLSMIDCNVPAEQHAAIFSLVKDIIVDPIQLADITKRANAELAASNAALNRLHEGLGALNRANEEAYMQLVAVKRLSNAIDARINDDLSRTRTNLLMTVGGAAVGLIASGVYYMLNK